MTSHPAPLAARFEAYCPSGEVLHAMRFRWQRPVEQWYCKDCVEVCLVVDGQGSLEEPPDRRVELRPGDGYLVAASIPYRVRPHPLLGLVEQRALCQIDWAEAVAARYRPPPPWAAGPVASRRPCHSTRFAQWRQRLSDLMAGRVDLLAAEAFLVDVLDGWRGQTQGPYDETDLPAWLRSSLIEMTAAGNLQGGPMRLARIAGLSLRQLNRRLHQHLGCNATTVITRLRLEHAARQLRLTDRSVAEVARLCGWYNRSYFSRLFVAQYGMPPGAYRRGQSADPAGG